MSDSASSKLDQPDSKRRPRRFAPLNPDLENKHGAPKLRGVVFDVDGTLCLPQNHMFKAMREALQIPKSTDILDHIKSLASDPSAQQRAITAVKDIERDAMTEQTPQPGLQELMTYLDRRKIPKALCTRNFLDPVRHLLDTFLPDVKFEPIITRETEGVRPKPSPEGIWVCARSWGLGGEDGVRAEDVLERAKHELRGGLIMVGDSIDDLVAGRRAGAATVLLVNEENGHLREREECDLGVGRLDELVGVLEEGFEGR
jgi:phosphoglycolate phosphatase-like HAD superfamily hydrolase